MAHWHHSFEKTTMKSLVAIALLALLQVAAVFAQANTTMTDGEIRRIDRDAKKLTIRHGPIINLNMPAMTMVFQVKDDAMLDTVQAGDKVRFHVEKVGGAYVVTEIGAVK